MHARRAVVGLVLVHAWFLAAGASGQTESGPPSPAADLLSSRLEQAREEASPSAFRLRVNCRGERGARTVEVFPSGVAVWDLRTQVVLDEGTRRDLLDLLAERGFPALEPQYGGRLDPARPQAAVRVVCRVALELDGLDKSSIQLAEGEQSAQLHALANDLLDRVAAHAPKGVTARDLADGLQKLALGALLPEGFELRFLDLPAAGGETAGVILRVQADVLSLQPYAPGHEVGEAVSRHLVEDELPSLVETLVQADFAALPVNLWSDDQLEIEVRVLGHGRTIYARPFSRLAGERPVVAQERLAQLVAVLRSLRAPSM
jgi:hypothetical protein